MQNLQLEAARLRAEHQLIHDGFHVQPSLTMYEEARDHAVGSYLRAPRWAFHERASLANLNGLLQQAANLPLNTSLISGNDIVAQLRNTVGPEMEVVRKGLSARDEKQASRFVKPFQDLRRAQEALLFFGTALTVEEQAGLPDNQTLTDKASRKNSPIEIYKNK